MAALSQTFRAESEKVHAEHQAILGLLESLEGSLVQLSSEPQAPATALDLGLRLVRELPEHCRHEEEKLHGTVGEVSPELAEFCALMRREHDAMRVRLGSFAAALDRFQTAPHLPATAEHLRNEGKTFIQQLRSHIELEERELSGFL